ncbi:MAG TPA: succinylglutamate desuccinylase/aspartoacylase family protein [Polyangia bacterium]
MVFEDYAAGFFDHARRLRDRKLTVRAFAEVVEAGRRYPLLRVDTPGRRRLLISAGFHGDETAGPRTLLERLDEITAYAAAADVGLTIYPSLNPSGFEDHTRYNRSGEKPNNDFLRYETEPGVWVGELEAAQKFLQYRLFRAGPKETQAFAAEIAEQPLPDAALDIHQDPYIKQPLAYAYSFGDSTPFRPLIALTERHLPISRNAQVDDDVYTDADGLIRLHDGSITDYFHRRGVPYTVALETTTSAAMPICHEVNLVWIKGFIDLAARR